MQQLFEHEGPALVPLKLVTKFTLNSVWLLQKYHVLL